MVETCYKRHKTSVNPIIEWADDDVWEFIKSEGIPYCSLYDEGFKRLGCIGCPMADTKGREREFVRWPQYKNSYILAFDRMLKNRIAKGMHNRLWNRGSTAKDVYNWWMQYDVLPGQFELWDEDLDIDL